MGIDSLESHSLERDKDKDAMDTSIDRLHNDESTANQADRSPRSPPSAIQIPPLIHEPPIEGKGAENPHGQNGKTSCRPCLIPFPSTLG